MPRRPVATEVEPNLHQAPGRSVHRWKRPFLGRLDGESLEIPARTGSIRDGGEHRTVLVDDDSHPHFDVSAEGSTGAPRNVRDHLMERRWRRGHVARTRALWWTPQRRAPAPPLPRARRRPESVTVILRELEQEVEVEPGCDGL